jgi:hypothetical protein
MLKEATADSSLGPGSIVVLQQFIQATRDSGYKSTASAVAELVDNAIQASASKIEVHITPTGHDDRHPLEVTVRDNGCGMPPRVLREALRFGGSTRFNSRSGLGRYGMGLPNSSLSQARRVEVRSWKEQDAAYAAYIDVDEIVAGKMVEVPEPERLAARGETTSHGTVVTWTKCDRLDSRRISTLERKLATDLGRRFRHFIWSGTAIVINRVPVRAIDPLFLHPDALHRGAAPFGETMDFEVRADPTEGSASGRVKVTFSELPVHLWAELPNEEKRDLGISKGAGISLVRAGREVDFGWFFMGGKRRENYDDWWRCEIRFDPVLDEAFGITHTKQQVRPKSYLLEALTPDLEATARTLNARARRAHNSLKTADRFRDAEDIAAKRDSLLKPLPPGSRRGQRALADKLRARHPELNKPKHQEPGSASYRIVEDSLGGTPFFTGVRMDDTLALVINPEHPFYKEVYGPLVDAEGPAEKRLRSQLELVLLSAARAEAAELDSERRAAIGRFLKSWSNTLAAFLPR